MLYKELIDGKSCAQTTDIKFETSYDLIVVGLGTAGAIAAVTATNNGISVLGIDKCNMCGGSATAGGVFGYYFGLEGGLFEEIDATANKVQDKYFLKGGCFHPDTKSMELENRITTNGGEIAYESAVVGVYTGDAGTVQGVKLVTPDGVRNCGCKMLIDASGDGEICAMAGAGFSHGRTLDGKPQPFSSVRVTLKADENRMNMANFDAGYVSVVDGKDLSRGILASNSLHRDASEPILWITTIPGVREGRLIECDETLKFKDFMEGKFTGKPVALCYSNFDSHSRDWAFENEKNVDWMVAASMWGRNFVIPVPLSCMLVKGFSNLMAAGRCLGVDHLMASAIRMQRGMQKLGEAAGLVTALAVKNNCEIRAINYDDIIGKLYHGLVMPGKKLPDCSWTEEASFKELLSGEKPGEAIWIMSSNINQYKSQLLEYINSDNQHLSRNSALALGIAGCVEAIPILSKIVREQDDFLPSSSRSQNQSRLHAAIYLLGKLRNETGIDPLLELIKNGQASNVQNISHCLISLLKLGDAIPARRKEIVESLKLLEPAITPENCRLLLKNSSTTGDEVFENLDGLCKKLIADKLSDWNK